MGSRGTWGLALGARARGIFLELAVARDVEVELGVEAAHFRLRVGADLLLLGDEARIGVELVLQRRPHPAAYWRSRRSARSTTAWRICRVRWRAASISSMLP